MDTTVIIWSLAFAGFAFAVYYRFFLVGKPNCSIELWELRGDTLLKHPKEYKGFFKKLQNVSGTKSVRWMFIGGIKRNWLIPKGNYFNPTTSGKRHLILLWLGSNHFEVMRAKFRRKKYLRIKGTENYKQVGCDMPEMTIIPQDLRYSESELEDTLENIYIKKKGLLEQLKPYYALGMIALVFIIMMYMVSKTVTDASEKTSTTAEWLQKAIEGVSTKRVDDNTVVKQDISKKGGG
tara:strand:- start:18351 stop:19058 length:708 start_codon:yes stop_codon:yes gene_type:complete